MKNSIPSGISFKSIPENLVKFLFLNYCTIIIVDSLQFFWLWYNNDRKESIKQYGGQYLNFSELNIDYLPQEVLQESCIYFSNVSELFLPSATHVAFASARYKEKFIQYNDPDVINLPHEKLLEIISHNEVRDYWPFHTNGINWYYNSNVYHYGIKKFLDQFIDIIECPKEVLRYDLGMSNSFMIEKELFKNVSETMQYGVKELYNLNDSIIEFSDCGFKNRALGCLWERLAGIAIYNCVLPLI